MSKNSDTAQVFNALRERRKERRRRFGQPCPACERREPKRDATILLPGQRCYCGYVDKRSTTPDGKELEKCPWCRGYGSSPGDPEGEHPEYCDHCGGTGNADSIRPDDGADGAYGSWFVGTALLPPREKD